MECVASGSGLLPTFLFCCLEEGDFFWLVKKRRSSLLPGVGVAYHFSVGSGDCRRGMGERIRRMDPASIHRPGKSTVDHDLCEAVSRRLSDALDEADPIEQDYILEVSSPGIERPLKKPQDYQRFAGSLAAVKLFAPVDGKKEYQGILVGLENDMVILKIKGKPVSFPLAQVAKAHLAVEF